jgi:hypothetical protein
MQPKHMLASVALLATVVGGTVIVNPFGLAQQARLPVLLQAERGRSGVCNPLRPTFYYGFAELQKQLGARMGDAAECEQSIHSNGDTRQRTTTGTAYYRKGANVPTFTDGNQHWALTDDGLAYWTGDVVDPPSGVAASHR